MFFFHILQIVEGVSSFGTAWAIFEIQSAKLVRISPGLTKYPPIIHTSGHTAYNDNYLNSSWSASGTALMSLSRK